MELPAELPARIRANPSLLQCRSTTPAVSARETIDVGSCRSLAGLDHALPLALQRATLCPPRRCRATSGAGRNFPVDRPASSLSGKERSDEPGRRTAGIEGRTLPALIDLDYGEWQGKTPAEIDAGWPGGRAAWRATPHLVRFPGGESLQDVVLRTADALRLMLERHPLATVVMVAHDSVNRALLPAATRPAALGLLAHRPGPLRDHRDRGRRRRFPGVAHQRKPASRRVELNRGGSEG
jgi:broad specificity phosphatase PhoE